MKNKMTSSIVSAIAITVFGGPLYTSGQPDPNNTNNWSTNNPSYTNTWPSISFPSNVLQWVIMNDTNFGLVYTIPHHLYEIQGSSNLVDWSLLVPAFTNLGTSTLVINLTNDYEFIRAKEVTFRTNFVNAGAQTNYFLCAGSYVALANYRNFTNNPNTLLHSFSDGEGLNRNIQAVGNHGHTLCSNGTVTVSSSLSSTVWDFTIFFSNSIPSNYPGISAGF